MHYLSVFWLLFVSDILKHFYDVLEWDIYIAVRPTKVALI